MAHLTCDNDDEAPLFLQYLFLSLRYMIIRGIEYICTYFTKTYFWHISPSKYIIYIDCDYKICRTYVQICFSYYLISHSYLKLYNSLRHNRFSFFFQSPLSSVQCAVILCLCDSDLFRRLLTRSSQRSGVF